MEKVPKCAGKGPAEARICGSSGDPRKRKKGCVKPIWFSWTWLWVSKHFQQARCVRFHVESEFAIENIKILQSGGKFQEGQNLEKYAHIEIVVTLIVVKQNFAKTTFSAQSRQQYSTLDTLNRNTDIIPLKKTTFSFQSRQQYSTLATFMPPSRAFHHLISCAHKPASDTPSAACGKPLRRR